MRYRNCLLISLCSLTIACWAAVVTAAVKLPAVIGENMVLQRDLPVPIWGWADKGEEVTVTVAGQKLSTKAGDDGRWKVTLAKLKSGKTLKMTVKGSSGNAITMTNILVGEVWVCSGQSNMQLGLRKPPYEECKNAAQEIAEAKYPDIRLLTVGPDGPVDAPQTNCAGQWVECSPATIPEFSAVGYFFGRQLHKDLKVPVGLINSSAGSSSAQDWTSRKALESSPTLKPLAVPASSRLYNGMLAPLVPYAIRGVIWYQGEANVAAAYQYRTLFPTMIADWRAAWGQGDFPFGYVQIAPFAGYSDCWGLKPAAVPELWEAQAMTLKASPNVGMVVTVDIADADRIHPKNNDFNGIHPHNKQEVGRRLSLWAMAKVYGRKLVYSGPIYRSMAVEGKKVRLQFDHSGSGLVASDGKPLTHFTIAGADPASPGGADAASQQFVPATATIEGNTIAVWSEQVAKPVAVRFAWRDDATPNLANKEGLPASPFRTDSWKGVTEL